VAYATGFTTVGAALAGLVAVLATLAATTGLCVGCEVYRIVAKLRGVRGGAIEQVDLDALGSQRQAAAVVLFTHPLCSDCQTLGRELDEKGTPVVRVDVSKRRDLAKKYGVSVVPLAFAVDASGRVTGRVG
jgi:glutaredoxin